MVLRGITVVPIFFAVGYAELSPYSKRHTCNIPSDVESRILSPIPGNFYKTQHERIEYSIFK